MEKKYPIDPELIKIAKEQDVYDILLRDGVPMVNRNGEYRHREHDSLVITPGKGFYWFSKGVGSRNPIDYYQEVGNMEFKDAVKKVLEVMNYDFTKKNVVVSTVNTRNPNYVKSDFVLPEKAEDNKRVYAYLTKTRCIDKNLVQDLINRGVLYQSAKYNNAVFVGKDYDGNIVSAFKRTTITDPKEGAWVKGDEKGSQKEFRFRIQNPTNKTVNVFESEIDLLSYISMQHELARNENYISLGGVSEKALEKFLEKTDIEHINICTDNDDAGYKACSEIARNFGKDYFITRELPKNKDFNQDLVNGEAYSRDRIEVISFEEETLNMTKKEKLEYVRRLFQEKYQGMTVPFEYPEERKFEDLDKAAKINADSRIHYWKKDKIETNKSFNHRLSIGVENDLVDFLKNSNYKHSSPELKQNQNKIHQSTKEWHYFEKKILIDNDMCKVIIDVRENQDHKTYLHKVRLEELEQIKKWQAPEYSSEYFKMGRPPFDLLNDTTDFEKKQEKTEHIENQDQQINKKDFSFSKDEEEFEY